MFQFQTLLCFYESVYALWRGGSWYQKRKFVAQILCWRFLTLVVIDILWNCKKDFRILLNIWTFTVWFSFAIIIKVDHCFFFFVEFSRKVLTWSLDYSFIIRTFPRTLSQENCCMICGVNDLVMFIVARYR